MEFSDGRTSLIKDSSVTTVDPSKIKSKGTLRINSPFCFFEGGGTRKEERGTRMEEGKRISDHSIRGSHKLLEETHLDLSFCTKTQPEAFEWVDLDRRWINHLFGKIFEIPAVHQFDLFLLSRKRAELGEKRFGCSSGDQKRLISKAGSRKNVLLSFCL